MKLYSKYKISRQEADFETFLMLPYTDPILALANLMSPRWFPVTNTLQPGRAVGARDPFFDMTGLLVIRDCFARMGKMLYVDGCRQSERRTSNFGVLLTGKLNTDQSTFESEKLGHTERPIWSETGWKSAEELDNSVSYERPLAGYWPNLRSLKQEEAENFTV